LPFSMLCHYLLVQSSVKVGAMYRTQIMYVFLSRFSIATHCKDSILSCGGEWLSTIFQLREEAKITLTRLIEGIVS